MDKALLRLTEIINTQKKRIEAMKKNYKPADYDKDKNKNIDKNIAININKKI